MISVVVPVYKGRGCLHALCDRLARVLESLPGVDGYELVLVEDCGNDGSWELIGELAAAEPRIKGLQMSRNFGQHQAITAGLAACRGDWAVIMDCDLQDRPEDIPLLWAQVRAGNEVVNARRGRRNDPLWRRAASRLYHGCLQYFSGLAYDPHVANFRIVSRKVIDAYLAMKENFRAFGIQVHWLGFSTAYVDIHHDERFEGKSSYSLGKLIAVAINTITAFSNRPLLFSVAIGFCMFIGSVGMTLYHIVKKLVWGVPVDGWSSLMVSLWFLGGIIIANLGIVGLYIGKIFDETRHRPVYVVARRVNC